MQDKNEGIIVGLLHGDNGRSCDLHEVCGRSLRVGDMISFETGSHPVSNWGECTTKRHISAHLVVDGLPTCLVGFIPQRHVGRLSDELNGRSGVITEVYLEGGKGTYLEQKVLSQGGFAVYYTVGN